MNQLCLDFLSFSTLFILFLSVLFLFVSTLIAYFATAVGLVGHTYIVIPWVTPHLLSGYLSTGDIRGTPSQIVITIIGLLVYAPLVSASNKAAKKQGLETAE